MSNTPLQNMIHRAVERIGKQELAKCLGATGKELDAWMNGEATVPARTILALAAVLEKTDGKPRE